MNQNRVQQGVPTGGQFAATARGEADVDLQPAADAAIIDAGAAMLPTFTAIGRKGEHPPTIATRLASLKEGDPVQIVTADGRVSDVTVTREFRRMDGGGFGSLDHGAVTVGYGRGRWNTEVTASRISVGVVELRVPNQTPTSAEPVSTEAASVETPVAVRERQYLKVDGDQRREIVRQIGTGNVLSISGGRVTALADGIEFPVSNGYRVRVRLCANDTYTVERIFTRSGVDRIKGQKHDVYAEEVSEQAFRAGMFRSYDEHEW